MVISTHRSQSEPCDSSHSIDPPPQVSSQTRNSGVATSFELPWRFPPFLTQKLR
jgi:hypothetical protein